MLGLALRLWLIFAANPTLASDARDYHDYAASLLAGRGYVQVYNGETEAFNGFTFRAFRPPGYPVFLAGLYAVVGWHLRAALLANIVADLITQLASAWIAHRLFGIRAAMLVSALLALHVLWTLSLMTESLHTALFSATLALLIERVYPQTTADDAAAERNRNRRGWLRWFAIGLLLMAGIFTRPITICLIPIAIWSAAQQQGGWRSRRAALALILLPTILTTLAWGWRNYAIFGERVWTTTNLGHHNAWEFDLNADMAFALLRKDGANEAEINSAMLADQRRWAWEHPDRWLRIVAWRAVTLFSLSPPPELTNVLWKFTFPPESAGIAATVYRNLYYHYWLVYLLAPFGLLTVRLPGGRFLIAVVLCFTLMHMLVSRGDLRLAAPLYPVLCVLIAGAAELVTRRR